MSRRAACHSSASSHGTALLPGRPGCDRWPDLPGSPDWQRYGPLPRSGHTPAPCSSSRSQARTTATILRRSLMSTAGSTWCGPAASRTGERLASSQPFLAPRSDVHVAGGGREEKKKPCCCAPEATPAPRRLQPQPTVTRSCEHKSKKNIRDFFPDLFPAVSLVYLGGTRSARMARRFCFCNSPPWREFGNSLH